MSSIDDVTASFATSLALAKGGGPVDIGHMAVGSAKRNSQSYFLGKVLVHKEVDKRALQNRPFPPHLDLGEIIPSHRES